MPSNLRTKIVIYMDMYRKASGELNVDDSRRCVDAVESLIKEQLETQKQAIVDKLENMEIEEVGNSAKTLDQAIELVKKEVLSTSQT